MHRARVTRRSLLRAAACTAALTLPFVRHERASAADVVPGGRMTLAWHTNIPSRWMDPQQHDGTATPDNFLMVNQDALIKNFREQKYDHLALADRFALAEDAESASVRLRPGIRFHDDSPVTPADVKWSYEHYNGAWAELLHAKTRAVDIVDNRTLKFSFREPFLDFPVLMGSGNVCGAAWVVPASYYQKVGKEGFLQKPIGAGPYRLVSQLPGHKLEYEAFDGYYRPVHVKSFAIVSVPEAAVRVAMLERGQADIMYLVPGELIDRVRSNPKLTLAPVLSGSWWLEFPGFRDPKNPFHDKHVREAVSLAIDRKAINDAESGGMGRVSGNWINDDVEDALDWPQWETSIPRARELMKQAGHPDGFNADWFTVAPNYFSRGERVLSQLKAIGIRARLQTMERGVYLKRMGAGLKEWPGVQIIMNGTRIGGSWSSWYDSLFKCGGFQSRDMVCIQGLDEKFARYRASFDRGERKKLAREIQKVILEEYYFVPIFRHAFVNAIGPRIKARKWQDVFPSALTTGYAYPWEDIELKEMATAAR